MTMPEPRVSIRPLTTHVIGRESNPSTVTCMNVSAALWRDAFHRPLMDAELRTSFGGVNRRMARHGPVRPSGPEGPEHHDPDDPCACAPHEGDARAIARQPDCNDGEHEQRRRAETPPASFLRRGA